jgi:hypothetical protein
MGIKMVSEKDEKLNKELFLQAVLAEYKALRDEMTTWERFFPIILSVWIGGVATLLGFFGVIGIVTLLVIPIFTSLCAICFVGVLSLVISIGVYVRKEIEGKKMQKIFPIGNLPITWEEYNKHQGGRYWQSFVIVLCASILLSCSGCLVILSSVFWTEVITNAFYILVYILGWVLTIFFAGFFLFSWLKIRSLDRN